MYKNNDDPLSTYNGNNTIGDFKKPWIDLNDNTSSYRHNLEADC